MWSVWSALSSQQRRTSEKEQEERKWREINGEAREKMGLLGGCVSNTEDDVDGRIRREWDFING